MREASEIMMPVQDAGGSVIDVEALAAVASILATMRDKKPSIAT